LRPLFGKEKKKLLGRSYWDQSKQERKAGRLANKNEDIPFIVTPASIPFLVEDTKNYFSSEELCYNLCFTHTLFSMKFFSFNLEYLVDPIWNIGFEPNPETQKLSLHDRWVSGISESGLAKVKVSRSLVKRNFFVSCLVAW